jgi:fumarate reductase flavoprotein subunit
VGFVKSACRRATVEPPPRGGIDPDVDVLIVGAGACGLVAALAARQAGASVLLLERDVSPGGTTAMSSGLIPAADSRVQRRAGVCDDSPALFAADILAKCRGRTDSDMVTLLTTQSAITVDWLVEAHEVPLDLVTAARLPGHSRTRLHGTPGRSGAELVAALYSATLRAGADVVSSTAVTTLFVEGGRVLGVGAVRPDASEERLGCRALVLACCGFAANRELVGRYLPEIARAVAHTHPGAQGDALQWGAELGAATADMTGYQGHGSLAVGHGLLIHWIVMSEGAIQVNALGQRFSDESQGYSEQAVRVLAQPDAFAWNIYDERAHRLMLEFEEYRDAVSAGAIRQAPSAAELAARIGVPPEPLAATLAAIDDARLRRRPDVFGRDFSIVHRIDAPYFAVKVTGALFHTQGGLVVDRSARVLRSTGAPLPNVFAGGGAARGVSGPAADGYLAGNGLLAATTLGRLAGTSAATVSASAPGDSPAFTG